MVVIQTLNGSFGARTLKTQTWASEPDRLGFAHGYYWFEHPTRGDESPLLIQIDGQWAVTDQWEIPD